MTDKERILTHIISRLSHSAIKYSDGRGGQIGNDDVHFVCTTSTNKLKINDLVLCQTSGIHDFTLGYVVSIDGYSEITIRELTSERIGKIDNDSYLVLKNISEESLLYGEQYKMKQKVIKAFARGDEWLYRYGGVKFDNNVIHVKVRERAAINNREPFIISFEWNKKMTIKEILQILKDNGYGTKWEV